MARLVGVNVDNVISMTFIIGSVLAAIGGVLVGSYIGQINFYIGFMAGVKPLQPRFLEVLATFPGPFLVHWFWALPRRMPLAISRAPTKMSLPLAFWCLS